MRTFLFFALTLLITSCATDPITRFHQGWITGETEAARSLFLIKVEDATGIAQKDLRPLFTQVGFKFSEDSPLFERLAQQAGKPLSFMQQAQILAAQTQMHIRIEKALEQGFTLPQ